MKPVDLKRAPNTWFCQGSEGIWKRAKAYLKSEVDDEQRSKGRKGNSHTLSHTHRQPLAHGPEEFLGESAHASAAGALGAAGRRLGRPVRRVHGDVPGAGATRRSLGDAVEDRLERTTAPAKLLGDSFPCPLGAALEDPGLENQVFRALVM